MKLKITKLEKGNLFKKQNNGEITELQQWRVTDHNGKQHLTWTTPEGMIPVDGRTYEVKETGTTIAWFNGDKGKSEYSKISLVEEIEVSGNEKPSSILSIPFEGENTSQPPQIVSMGSESDYHDMSMRYLSTIGKLNLINIYKLSPYMKSICEGTISENKLAQLNNEFYNDMMI